MTRILIDADGCPVVDLIIKIAKEFQLNVTIFCDTAHQIEREGADTVMVSKGSDAVDFVLVNRLQKGDIVVTQDYGLAAMVLAKSGYAIDQNGRNYTSGNIEQLLFTRHLGQKIRQAGGRTKGPKKRSKEANLEFAEAFRRLCKEILTKS
ncbi:YaiI/YqxD family protein [Viridibacillus arvi]|uniref:YaiI/YqxD family protein n=1 Tax=Viridibacillus arvi TaxID=263475 RepID=UPI003679B86B